MQDNDDIVTDTDNDTDTSTDNDEMILEDAKEVAFAMDKAYRRAMRTPDIDRMTKLKPYVSEVFEKYSLARLKLLEEGVLANDKDVEEMGRIRADIEQAAATQALITGAIKFAGFIAKFA